MSNYRKNLINAFTKVATELLAAPSAYDGTHTTHVYRNFMSNYYGDVQICHTIDYDGNEHIDVYLGSNYLDFNHVRTRDIRRIYNALCRDYGKMALNSNEE